MKFKLNLCLLILILPIAFSAGQTYGIEKPSVFQTVDRDTIPTIPPDSLQQIGQIIADTTDTIRTQTLTETDTSLVQESGILQRPNNRESNRQSQQAAVNFQAQDSLIFDFRNQRKGYLYGSANVQHTSGTLTAGKIDLDLNKRQIEARSLTPDDTLSYPVFKQDGRDLRTRNVMFNYETEKGRFEVAETQIDDGYIIGTKVKNVSRTEVFIEDGIYSTCPPEHMYYYIRAQRMKVVDEEEVFFTNARLYLLDIPYPLVFPFGYVPAGMDQRQSGLLEPTYMFQNTSTRGLGVQQLGWFQYFNDYMVGQTSFDIFTSGTFYNQTRFQYRNSDRYNGSISLGYSLERGLESTDLNFSETVSRRLGINHSQQLSPFASLTADINLNTSNFFQRNSFDLDERAQTSSTSRVAYRYNHPEGAYNFSVTSNLNQQFNTNVATLTGPETNFSIRQFNPFESEISGTEEQSWYERITVSYQNRFRSSYRFNPTDRDSAEIDWFEALLDPAKYREATGNDQHVQYGFIQTARVNAGQLIPSQYLNISAGIDYNEYWYPTTTERSFDPEENRVVADQVRGFAAARDFNTNLSFNTTFYGVSQMRVGNFEGLRHTVRPNVSFSYQPDFSDDFWGFYEEVQADTLGNTQRFSKFDREVFRGPPSGEQRTISFGATNIVETKRVKRDSTGEIQSTNVRLIDNLSINSNYNFAADSLNFGNITVSMSSRLLEGIRLQANASYSLYDRNENGLEIDRFLWQSPGPRALQPLQYRVSASTSFSGGRRSANVHTPPYRPYDPYDQQFFSPIDRFFNDRPIQSIDAPWSFGLNFSYSWRYRFGQSPVRNAVLNATNIQFNLTQKWNFSTRIGYDFIEKELTPSQFNLTREMICWNLSFQFNPIGEFQYYSFRLSLNNGQIQSLFQKLPGLNNLERSSSPNGRPPQF